jgi:hypothetical protein
MNKFLLKLYPIIVLTFLLMGISMASINVYTPDQETQFTETGVCVGCDLTSTVLSTNSDVQTPYNLENSNISNSTYANSNNTLSNFGNIVAIQTSFVGRNYSQVNFESAILIEANFRKAVLTNANFTNANVRDATFEMANLYGAIGIDFASVKSVCDAIMPDGSKGKCY